MNRSAEEWSRVVPERVVEGSATQARNVLAMALQDIAEVARTLSDPAAVHLNMLRGGIARPSWANIQHLYVDEAAALLARVAELEAALRDCTCPRPMNSEPDNLTIGQCMDKLQCGCCYGIALSKEASA